MEIYALTILYLGVAFAMTALRVGQGHAIPEAVGCGLLWPLEVPFMLLEGLLAWLFNRHEWS